MVNWPKRFWKEGFNGRIFLSEEEWRTFLRRQAVRYTDQSWRKPVCDICGKAAMDDNPLQLAHRISFLHGVRYLALTPDFLDGPDNLVTAHRKSCNRAVELGAEPAMARLVDLGVQELPMFLPENIRALWPTSNRNTDSGK